MGFPLKLRIGQVTSISSPANVQTPCRRYDVPNTSTSVDIDRPPTMSRRISLPAMQANIYARSSRWGRRPISRSSNSTRSASISSTRRAVTGMKNLLPLVLPRLSSSEKQLTSDRRLTFGQEPRVEESYQQEGGSVDDLEEPSHPHLTISTEEFRDTPVYSDRGTPMLDYTYSNDEHTCSHIRSPNDESYIMHEYQTFNDERTTREDQASRPRLSVVRMAELSPVSDLSFKCLGAVEWDNAEPFGRPVYCTSAEWLSSTLNPDNRTANQTMRSGIDIENWIQEHTTTGFYDSGDDEGFARATALTPARAHVIDVYGKSTGLGINIPPRSSSLARTPSHFFEQHYDYTESYLHSPPASAYSTPWSEDEEYVPTPLPVSKSATKFNRKYDLAMQSPPISPMNQDFAIPCINTERRDSYHITSFQTYEEALSASQQPLTSIHAILSSLEIALSDSSTLLLPDNPCIIAIRAHLNNKSPPFHSPPLPLQHPSNPYPRRKSAPTTHHHHHVRKHPLRTPSTATTKSYPPALAHFSPPTRAPPSIPSSSPQAKTDPTPLQKIFPLSTPLSRSALYASILAWKFLSTLSSTCSLSTTVNHSDLTEEYEYSTIPAKAASRLGIPSTARIPRGRGKSPGSGGNVMGGEMEDRIRRVKDEVELVIGGLVRVMEGRKRNGRWEEGKGESEEERVEGWVVRALLEVLGLYKVFFLLLF